MEYLNKDEQIGLSLRELYERFGYRKANVAEFEEYDLLVGNRNLFDRQNIITFMNTDGRLMALRPDVTLSIIKNVSGEETTIADKYYYVESVYRFFKENDAYRRIDQIGVEHIGGNSWYANQEVLSMALDTLEMIHENFILDISHMGFISGLLDGMGMENGLRESVLTHLHSKNTHDLGKLLAQTDLGGEQKEKILALCGLSGPFEETLSRAYGLAENEAMTSALDELKKLFTSLRSSGCGRYAPKIVLDFSVINNLDYYNTFLFRGYIENLSKEVLTGGRYDNLMKKLGKNRGGIGFAVSLDELARYYDNSRNYDYDMVIIYNKNDDIHRLLSLVREYAAAGRRVRTECVDNAGQLSYTYRELYHLDSGQLKREV